MAARTAVYARNSTSNMTLIFPAIAGQLPNKLAGRLLHFAGLDACCAVHCPFRSREEAS